MALTDSLISSYTSLGDSLNDEHGASNLTQNGTLTSTTGLIGNCLDGDGTSTNYLSGFPSMYGKTAFTVECWMQADAKNAMIMAENNASVDRTYYLYQRATTGYVEIEATNSSGTNYSIIDSNAVDTTAGSWVHIVAVFGIGTNAMILYVNGSSGGTASPTGTFGYVASGSPTAFRRESAASPLGLNGRINTLRFWDRALSSTEVTELYNSGAGLTYAGLSGGGGGNPTEAGALNFGGGL